jgi:hypothetical protein
MRDTMPHRGFYVIKVHDLMGEAFLQFLEVRERNCGGSSFWILHNGGIIDWGR